MLYAAALCMIYLRAIIVLPIGVGTKFNDINSLCLASNGMVCDLQSPSEGAYNAADKPINQSSN